MVFNLSGISRQSVSLFKDSFLPSLTTQQKKILLITSIVFSLIAAFYVIKRCFSKDAILYEGEMKKGKLHGKGKMTFPDGKIFDGHFENGLLNGQGQIIIPKHSTSVGIFLDGHLHGQGIVIFENEVTQEGEFEKGIFMNGKITYANGVIFEGQRNNGLLCGKLMGSNGAITDVEDFQDIPMQGHGKTISKDGDIFIGEFKNWGFYKGQYKESSGILYEGEFENNMFKKGKITFPGDGGIFEGEVQGNCYHGKHYLHDGTVDEATFKPNGLLTDGPIKITLPDGTIFQGNYIEARAEIEGTRTDPKGQVEKGPFQILIMDGKRRIEKPVVINIWTGKEIKGD